MQIGTLSLNTQLMDKPSFLNLKLLELSVLNFWRYYPQ
jgi:hypothetical protein